MTRSQSARYTSRRAFLLTIAAAVGGLLAACAAPSAPTAAPTAGGAAATAPTQAAAPAPASAAATAAAQINQAAPTQAAAAPSDLPRNQTLYVGGFQWDPPTTFNPLATGLATWPAQGAPNTPQMHMYEALFGYNLQSGNLDPILAKDLSWPDNKTAVVTMQPGTHWQDGQPLTADDVVYSFQIGKNFKDAYFSTLWDYLSGVTAKDPQTIQFDLNSDKLNPGMVKFYLGAVYVLPRHVWQARESGSGSIVSFQDMQPVGSGPYKLQTASPERVVLVRDDNYWGKTVLGTPKPQYLVHQIFKSNDDGNLAFQRGELDISQQFTPQIWQMWEQQNLPVGTWFKQEPYHLPGGIPIMHINLSKPGLNNVNVRRALAYSINYEQIAATAMSRYSVPAMSSLMVPGGVEQKFIDKSAIAANGWSYDATKATQLLEQAGAKKGSDGIYALSDGTRLGPWKVICPYGWTDWMTALELVAQGAQAVGLDVSTDFPQAATVNSSVGNGDFDLAMWPVSGVSAASPWLRFRDVLDNRGVPAPGQRAFWDYNRYSNPAVAALLDQAAAATTEQDQANYYSQLDKIFMQDVPSIPLMYRPLEFYEYNQSTWTGFPNSDNPSSPPTQSGAGVKLLYGLQPKSA